MKIGSIVIHCHDFDRTVAFWQAALHYEPREPAKDDWVVLRDPKDKGPNLSFQGRDRRPRSRSWLPISTSTPRTSKPKLSDWSLWERDDIPGGIVLETTSLCLRTREAPSSASCRRPTCRAIRAAADTPGRRPAMASDKGGFSTRSRETFEAVEGRQWGRKNPKVR
jgi:hypothetical protein